VRLRDRVPAENVYLLLTGFYAFTYSIVLTVTLVYQTQTAGLSPFQLVLGGTALQASTFLLEVPTGVFADVRGRRLSVVIGIASLGLAFALMGSSTRFEVILASQFIIGAALTFVSGAQEAWIADEVGVAAANRIYLRSAQTVQYARIVGIPAGIGLGLISLRLPLLLGSLMFGALALVLAVIMREEGFMPGMTDDAGVRHGFRRTLMDGMRLTRNTPILVTLFGMVAFYELAGEVFVRLSVIHFLDDIGLPKTWHLEPVAWFGIMRLAASVAGLGGVQYLRRHVDVTDRDAISGWLIRINVLQMLSLFVFGLTTGFAVGFAAYLAAMSLSRMFQPLYLALLNSHTESNVRATVISMSSQVDALGQTVGAPLLGLVASLVNVRAALVATALLVLPALGLNVRASGQQQAADKASPA
jgi:DHA3 family tetracycline resistance protein-like MFS transporter